MMQKLRRLIGSDTFFYATLVFLAFESLWIALSGLYPMAYDENFHLGIIQLYAQHLSPVWFGPVNVDGLGAVWRDPSYMYHYLMSFPYRLLTLMTSNLAAKVIVLRLFSIVFMVAGVYFYRRVLLLTKASRPLVNVVFALFVLTPTVPFLAAQLNYDNLLFLLVALSLLLAIRLVRDVRNRSVTAVQWLLALALYLLSSLVMYAYLPIFMALAVWLGFEVVRAYGWRNLGMPWRDWWRSFSRLRVAVRIALALLVVVSGGLFTERYGVNAVNYGSPLPDCAQVLYVDQCLTYAPWRRNYDIYQAKIAGKLPPVNTNPFVYIARWVGSMSYQLLYTLNGFTGNFTVGQPLPLPFYLVIAIGVVGLPLLLWKWRRIVRQPWLGGLLFVAGAYLLALWARNYSDFLHLHIAVAIQSRYLVQVLPILYLMVALAFAHALKSRRRVKTALASGAIAILLLQGGGAMVFILRSDAAWYWPNPIVRSVNSNVRNVLKKLVVGG
jgi:hypothetical protein